MKKIFFLMVLFVSIHGYSQQFEDLKKETEELKTAIKKLQIQNSELSNKIESAKLVMNLNKSTLDSLSKIVSANQSKTENNVRELNSKFDESSNTSNLKFSAIDNSISKKSLYWIISFLAIALIVSVVYFMLGKKIKSDKTQVEQQIADTKKAMEEETVKLDTKLTELLESQLKLVEAEKTNGAPKLSEDVDHSLALKVADEIVRINKNLSNMDSGTKGIKQLAASVKRIEDNFAANGYEMPELLNKPFNSGMKIIVANSIPDENLSAGQEIISRIIKPQVNYKGIMIQAAQVEVSVGQN